MVTSPNSFTTRAFGMTTIAFLVALGAGAQESSITADEVEQFFVRYMANGRSNVEMQYRLSGSGEYASGEYTDDRVYMSTISLYEVPAKIRLETEYLRELGKRWVFIHESQHALVLPHLNPKEPSVHAPIDAWVAFRLVQQTHENAADARAIARIWKIDGSEGARELASAIINFRDVDRPGHQTQCAVRAMVATLNDRPELVASDVDEFRFVLDTAEHCAIVTENRLLTESVGAASASAVMQRPAILEALENIQTGLSRVARDYESARFENTAATIRFGTIHSKSSPRDYHFYVGAGNVITRDPVLGGEGARGKVELEEAMRVPGSPERFFAIEGVKNIGNLTRDRLSDSEIVFKRFVEVFAGTSHERRARAYDIVADVIRNIDVREDLEALYTEVNRRLLFELGYPQ
ncbi:MAG TPA: hypothetical protein DEH78_12225 [Solibacterales bacterium]|nr:hypothetical protein [Bryobacterales bacterium]